MDSKIEKISKSMIKHPEWDLKRVHDVFDHWEKGTYVTRDSNQFKALKSLIIYSFAHGVKELRHDLTLSTEQWSLNRQRTVAPECRSTTFSLY